MDKLPRSSRVPCHHDLDGIRVAWKARPVNDEVNDERTTILDLRRRIEAFVAERDWEQFHTPKDLAAAIAIEAAELQELFLWKSAAEVEVMTARPEAMGRIREELADVVILCLNLANRLHIDVAEAVTWKMAANAAKYPVALARGRSDKYDSY